MELQSLIEQAKNGDMAERRAAIRKLANYPTPESLATLVDALQDTPQVADAAVHALLTLGGETAARVVAPLLGHEHVRPRSAALDVLIGLKEAAVPVLLELLHHQDRELRKMAAEVLAQSNSCAACPELIKLLDDPDSVVRAAAAAAVSALQCEKSADQLLRHLQEEQEEWVRFALAAAVARTGSAAHIQTLLQLVPSGPIADLVRAELRDRDLGGSREGVT